MQTLQAVPQRTTQPWHRPSVPKKDRSLSSLLLTPLCIVYKAYFSLSVSLLPFSLAPSTISVCDPQGQDLLEICPLSYFKTVSDRLARPLTHFRLITPSLCDTNQLWMKKTFQSCKEALSCVKTHRQMNTKKRWGREGERGIVCACTETVPQWLSVP